MAHNPVDSTPLFTDEGVRMARYCIHCGSDDVVEAEAWDKLTDGTITIEYFWECRYCHMLSNAVHIRESYRDRMLAKGWFTIPCGNCGGDGIIDVGFLEVLPDECPRCAGNGVEWVTPNGRTMDYPSGRFTGRLDKEYHEELREKYGIQTEV
jgi:hypothetical protein